MINRFLKEGIESFEPHNILELVLFGGITRKNTNEIAHRLIDTFGFCGTFDADYEELLKVEGVGPAAAAQIKLAMSVCRKYNELKYSDIKIIKDIEHAAQYMQSSFLGRDREMLTLLCLDASGTIKNYSVIAEGSVNSVHMDVRKLVETALKYKASAVFVAHNHPGSNALPSAEDIRVTQKLLGTLSDLGIKLMDHFVFAPDGDFVSFTESNLLRR